MRDDINHESRSRTGLRDRLALEAVPRRSRVSSTSPDKSYERRLSGVHFANSFFRFLSLCIWHVKFKYLVSL